MFRLLARRSHDLVLWKSLGVSVALLVAEQTLAQDDASVGKTSSIACRISGPLSAPTALRIEPGRKAFAVLPLGVTGSLEIVNGDVRAQGIRVSAVVDGWKVLGRSSAADVPLYLNRPVMVGPNYAPSSHEKLEMLSADKGRVRVRVEGERDLSSSGDVSCAVLDLQPGGFTQGARIPSLGRPLARMQTREVVEDVNLLREPSSSSAFLVRP